MLQQNGQIPFPALAGFRNNRDPYGRWQGGCVQRSFVPEHIFSITEMVDMITRTPSLGAFRTAFIVAHNSVHNSIGGNMATVYSCFDPIFMLHHRYVIVVVACWWLHMDIARSDSEEVICFKLLDTSAVAASGRTPQCPVLLVFLPFV